MAMVENESIEDGSSSTQTETKTISETNLSSQSIDHEPKLGPDLGIFPNAEQPLNNNEFFDSFEADFCTKQSNKFSDLIENQHLLGLGLFNQLGLETNPNLAFSECTQFTEIMCSYCSRTDTKLLGLDCSMHKICSQCYCLSSSSSSRKNSEPGFKLKIDFTTNTTNSETSGSVESSSVSSSDDNLDLRFEQLVGIKCKLCSMIDHDLKMNKLFSSSMSSSSANSAQLSRMLSSKSNTITDECIFDENLANLTVNQSNDQIFDLFPNSSSVFDVLKHLSMDQDDFSCSSLNQLTPVNSFQCMEQNYRNPSSNTAQKTTNPKQNFPSIMSNFKSMDSMNAPLNLPSYLNNSSSSSSSSTSSASSTSSQTLTNHQNFTTLAETWSLNFKNCQSCHEKPESICYCLDCKERLCRNCYLAHQRVRLTKEHRIQFLELNNNMDIFLLSNHNLMPQNLIQRQNSSHSLNCFSVNASLNNTASSNPNRVSLISNSPELTLTQNVSIFWLIKRQLYLRNIN